MVVEAVIWLVVVLVVVVAAAAVVEGVTSFDLQMTSICYD